MATKSKEAPKQPAAESKRNVGKVVQVIGPVQRAADRVCG